MSSQFTTHLPADPMVRGDGGSGSPERPVVLIAFAKMVTLAAALLLFTPLWLEQMAQLAYGPAPQAWGLFRLVALVGSVAFLATIVMLLRVWTRLLKQLARAD